MTHLLRFSILLLICLVACKDKPKPVKNKPVVPPKLVVKSLTGKAYFEPKRAVDAQSKLDSNLTAAKKSFESNPTEDNLIWWGRREAYLSHFEEAIAIFTEGVNKYPESYKILRHRGHRYISVREFDKAIEDLVKAAQLMRGKPIEIEPDGIPNKINQPLSSVQFNIWYHLGLAYYLKEDFPRAEAAYKKCMAVSDNDDLKVATTDWLYMTYRRAGKDKEAADLLKTITPTMTIVENDSYFQRLLMYKGLKKPEDLLTVNDANADKDLALATQGYGVGNWYLYNGDAVKAKQVFEQVTAGNHFSAFGFIAAEADLRRMR
jgi:tetratricopeptide (TPR) repeat protein